MLTAYEKYLLACYLANAATGLDHRDREVAELADWIADRKNRAAFFAGRQRSDIRDILGPDPEDITRAQFRRLRQSLRNERPARIPRQGPTGRRLQHLARTTRLTEADSAILELLLRYRTNPVFESLIDDVFIRPSRWHDLNVRGRGLPLLLDLSPRWITTTTPVMRG